MEKGVDGSIESNRIQRRDGSPIQTKRVLLSGINEERDMGAKGMASIPND